LEPHVENLVYSPRARVNQPQVFGRRQKLSLISQMVTARLSRQDRDFADCFTDDAILAICGDPAAIRCAGRWVGREQILEAVRFFDAELRTFDFQIDTALIDGDQAAMRWRMTIERRGGGGAADTACLLHLKFRDWLISEFTLATDTALVDAIVHGN
jgi:SnoaL-like domain